MAEADLNSLRQRAAALLVPWAKCAEQYWADVPDAPELGCYGLGYSTNWTVQTNLKYAGTVAALAALGSDAAGGLDQKTLVKRALASLRFAFAAHFTGSRSCLDNEKWGRTWISALGIERMMYGVHLLRPHMSDADQASLRAMLCDEADYAAFSHERGGQKGIHGDVWGRSGKNNPESNLWSGAVIWRTAEMYPDHPRAAEWREQAHRFLINSVSVAADANDKRVVDGKPVCERFVGPNFFPNFALDHHAYMNVGYMTICVSNAAMLHFDMKLIGKKAPETLYHHQAELWQALRRMIFSDGRLARIGGDSRLRYTYCQEYLIPALLFAAEKFADPFALELLSAKLSLIEEEARFSGDGSFYGGRLRENARTNPYYYSRLESDRACVLGMLLAYAPVVELPKAAAGQRAKSFEDSVAGNWHEPEHGDVLHRCSTRFASFAWRAYGLAQGMCLPPGDGHVAEWEQNLGGQIIFAGEQGIPPARSLVRHQSAAFYGGFVTCGAVREGTALQMDEGWKGTDTALHWIAFAALPDGRSVVALERCAILARRSFVREIKGMHLNVPNDLYNRFRRTIEKDGGVLVLESPAAKDEFIGLKSRWVNVEGRVAAVGLYGADEMAISRAVQRRGGKYHSLYVDEICWPGEAVTRPANPRETILDAGWMTFSGIDAATTKKLAASNADAKLSAGEDVRAARVTGCDGKQYVFAANFSEADVVVPKLISTAARDLATQEKFAAGATLALKAGEARLLAL